MLQQYCNRKKEKCLCQLYISHLKIFITILHRYLSLEIGINSTIGILRVILKIPFFFFFFKLRKSRNTWKKEYGEQHIEDTPFYHARFLQTLHPLLELYSLSSRAKPSVKPLIRSNFAWESDESNYRSKKGSRVCVCVCNARITYENDPGRMVIDNHK